MRVVRAGTVPYATAYEWQRVLHASRVSDLTSDVLLMLEHPHVYTLGRRFQPQHLLLAPDELERRGVEVFEADRGGSVTYHGPGQLVAYPIIDLRRQRPHPDVISYLRGLERAIIEAVVTLGVPANVREGLTGVWVEDRKLASIGVNVSRGVSKHGLALNVSTELDYFRWMMPCGIDGAKVTSLERELGAPVPLAIVERLLAESLADVLGRDLVGASLRELGLEPVPRTIAGQQRRLRVGEARHA
ncbi:MAG: lipoyl(octanoyl) transferase LipB [Actinomycetota bacterium]|nr:lipoyl(octanoyl) transferase LipB [Actinomycetota bacterium]